MTSTPHHFYGYCPLAVAATLIFEICCNFITSLFRMHKLTSLFAFKHDVVSFKSRNFRLMSTAVSSASTSTSFLDKLLPPASTQAATRNVSSNGRFLLSGLRANLAETMEQCFAALEYNNLPIYPVTGKALVAFDQYECSHFRRRVPILQCHMGYCSMLACSAG